MLDIIVIIELAIAGCINMAELAAWWSDGGNDDGGCLTFPMHESAIRTEIDNNVNRINIPFQMLDLLKY